MPRVPVYGHGAPIAEQKPLKAPDVDPGVSPTAADFGGIQAEQRLAQAKQEHAAGAAMLGAGLAFGKIAADIMLRDDTDSALRAETSLNDDYIKQQQVWRTERKGRFATGLTDDVSTWFEETTKKHGDTLTNERQRHIFNRRVAATRESGLKSMSQFQAVELEHSYVQAAEASIGATTGIAIADPTKENIDNARTNLRGLITSAGARNGWEDVVVQQKILAATTVMHKGIVEKMADTNPSLASAYFEQHKGEIDPKLHAQIGKFAKAASDVSIGGLMGESAWRQYGPRNLGDPVDSAKLEDAINEATRDNPEMRKAGLEFVRAKKNAHNATQVEFRAKNAGAVALAIAEGNTGYMNLPEYRALDDGDKAKMHDYNRQQVEHKENRIKQARREEEHDVDRRFSLGQRSRTLRLQREDDRRKSHDGEFLRLMMDPDGLVAKSPDQLNAMLPDLGLPHVQMLHRVREGYIKNHQALETAKIDNEMFKDIARQGGFNPDAPPSEKDERAKVGALRANIERKMVERQRELKRPMEDAEKRELMERTIDEKAQENRGPAWVPDWVPRWGGTNDTTLAAIPLTPSGLKSVRVPNEARNEIVSMLRSKTPAQIEAGIRSRGLTTLDELIAHIYVQGQQRK